MGNYKKFINGYRSMTVSLTNSLKMKAFHYIDESTIAINQLKEAMISPPMLGLQDFTKIFLVECDASRVAIGEILIQDGRDLAYLSQAL